MKPHDTYLELAAVAIDFPLDAAERRRLDQHLRACQACARTASMLREDAVALAHLAPVMLPERRAAEIIAEALRPAPVRLADRLLLVAALLALLLLGTVVVGAGSMLLRLIDDNDLAVILPVPSQSAAPGYPAAPVGRLAVTHGENGRDWIEMLTMDGATTRLAEGRDPAWLSGDTIVFTCPDPEGQPGICSVRTDPPSDPQSLFAAADRPIPAPGGRLVAVHRGTIDVGETWLMSPEGAEPRLLRTGAFDRWSPDGAWLAGQPEGAVAEVAMVRVDGTGFRVLAPGYDPTWSPSGDRITYAFTEDAGASIRSVYLDDGEVEILVTAPPGSELATPAWLPDGRLLYVQDGDLWLFDPGQSASVRFTVGASIHAGSNTDPLAVAPLGGWVAYTNGVDARALVELGSLDGSSSMSFPWTGPVTQPVWAPPTAPSPDDPGPLGSIWTEATMPTAAGVPTGQVESVITGGIEFLAIGRGCLSVGDTPNCEGIVWQSADGTAWERVPTSDALDTGAYFASSGPEIGMFDVEGGGSGFVAIGYAARPRLEATVWYSPDALTWERIPLGDASTTRVNAVAWDGQRLIIVGEDRSDWDGTLEDMATATARAAVWTSDDGRTWTRTPHSPIFDVGGFIDTMEDPITGGMSDIVAGPAGMVAVGSTCTRDGACQPAVWTTPTEPANSWERVTGLESVSGVLRSVAALDTGYAAVGTGEAAVMTSPDARTWTVRQAPASDLETVTRIGDRLLATAPSGPEVWASTDGQGWAPLEAEGGPLTDAAGQGAHWRFGADNLTAVWFGVTDAGPAAWVSNPQPAP